MRIALRRSFAPDGPLGLPAALPRQRCGAIDTRPMISFAVAGLNLPWWLPLVAALTITLVTSMIGLSGAFLLVPFQVSILGVASPAA